MKKRNIIFLTLAKINDIFENGIYTDLLRQFIKNNYDVTIVCPIERRFKKKTNFREFESYSLLQIKTLNIQKANVFEKGLGTLLIDFQFLYSIRKFLKYKKYDIVLYSTPPITFTNTIRYLKNSGALTYLLLKDIFPQNAVDLGMIKKGGLIYKYFSNKEKQLYQISDFIGVMSEANKLYLNTHNSNILNSRIEINPNSIEINPNSIEIKSKRNKNIFFKYKIPEKPLKLIYGGNLGLPQGISFFKEVLKEFKNENRVYFIICGDGTEATSLKNFIKDGCFENVIFIDLLPKREFDDLVAFSDIGLIFLDRKFTIPNFPSRLLTYLYYKLPVIAATDNVSDVGTVLEKTKSGFKVESGNIDQMKDAISKFIDNRLLIEKYGNNAYNLLIEKYSVENSFKLIDDKLCVQKDN